MMGIDLARDGRGLGDTDLAQMPPAHTLRLTACPGCGTLQRVPAEGRFNVLECAVCGTAVDRVNGRSSTASLAFASATFLLLIPANLLPFLTTSLAGVSRQSVLGSSARVMFARGYPELGIVIGLMVVVLPLVRFGLLTAVLGALRLGRRPHWIAPAFRCANALQTWAMADVFLLGFVVAYERLDKTISVQVGTGAMCFIAAAILSLLTRATLEPGAVWRAIAPDRAVLPGQSMLACESCEMTAPLTERDRPCARCGARLRVRIPGSVTTTAALVIAAALLYLPANFFPIATLPLGLSSVKYTVLEGVIDLVESKLYGLAGLVFVASFAIPFLKVAVIAWCVISVLRRSRARLVAKTRLYLLVDEIGRWSMVDPFVISCFVPVTQYNALIHGSAEPAAPAFTAVVVLTMLATRYFDPRLLWDPRLAGTNR